MSSRELSGTLHISGPARGEKTARPVEAMLKLHKDLPKTKMPHEAEALQRQIAATDSQIDSLVYEPYGLTEEEMGIVEGGRG